MLRKREMLSAMLFGRSALTMATGIRRSTTARPRALRSPRSAGRAARSSRRRFRTGRRNDRGRRAGCRRPSAGTAPTAGRSGQAPPCSRRAAPRSGGEAIRAEDRDQRIARQDAHDDEDDDRDADHGQRPEFRGGGRRSGASGSIRPGQAWGRARRSAGIGHGSSLGRVLASCPGAQSAGASCPSLLRG